jgi:hypothetical protein
MTLFNLQWVGRDVLKDIPHAAHWQEMIWPRLQEIIDLNQLNIGDHLFFCVIWFPPLINFIDARFYLLRSPNFLLNFNIHCIFDLLNFNIHCILDLLNFNIHCILDLLNLNNHQCLINYWLHWQTKQPWAVTLKYLAIFLYLKRQCE